MPDPELNLRPAIFVDRDGVLIENRKEYIRRPCHIHVFQQAIEAAKRITASPFALVVVSNQAAVGRGILSMQRVCALNRRIVRLYEREGVRIDGSYICPHKPDDNCDCRKPKPGMLLQAARELNLDLTKSYMVGDNMTDMGAANAAGVKGILVRTGLGSAQLAAAEVPYEGPVAHDLSEAVQMIFNGELG